MALVFSPEWGIGASRLTLAVFEVSNKNHRRISADLSSAARERDGILIQERWSFLSPQ
jgi:hypothetical protein